MQAVQRLHADHRLILSGTPIQNNVQELWVLFNFLMPGFLGTELSFQQRFGKAFKSGKAGKAGSNEAQAGLLAMDGLHKQVKHMTCSRVALWGVQAFRCSQTASVATLQIVQDCSCCRITLKD